MKKMNTKKKLHSYMNLKYGHCSSVVLEVVDLGDDFVLRGVLK
jgi:hypothetical protein